MKLFPSRLNGSWFVGFLLLFVLFPGRAGAQSDQNAYSTGFPSNGIFDGSDFDNVQLQNGNLHIQVPLYQAKGRGPSMFIRLNYDGLAYSETSRCLQQGCYYTYRGAGGGWSIGFPTAYGVSATAVNFSTCNTHVGITAYTNIRMTEPDGTSHHFVPDQPMLISPGCFTTIPNGVLYADDGSGWMLKADPNSGDPVYNGYQFDLFSKDGTEIKAVYNSQTLQNDVTLTDPNGNQITYTSSNSTVTDTVGRGYSTNPGGSWCLGAIENGTQCVINYVDSNGVARAITISFVSVDSSFPLSGCSKPFCTPWLSSVTMPSQVMLPNGLQYSFNYFNTANPNGLYGEVFNATLPTGGSVAWTWQMASLAHTQVLSRTVTANGNNFTWNYAFATSIGNPPTTTVTDAALNDTVYAFGGGSTVYSDYSDAAGPTTVQNYSGTGGSRTLLKTVTTTYPTSGTMLPLSETTTWAQTNQVSQVQTDWDSFNTGQRVISWRNPINKREYAFGTGAPGSLVRTTSNNYLHLTNSSYLNLNIANKPTSTIVYEANGVTVHAKTLYSYDNTILAASSGVVNHDYTHFSSTNTLRGNSTQIQRWRNTDGALLNTYNYYNDIGNMLQTMDPASHNTYFDYTDSWYQSTCTPPSGTAQAFVTKKTNALSQFSTAKYNSCSSLVGSTTDLNSQITTHVYDSMGRRTQTNLPGGGQVSVSYGNTLPINVVTTTKITSSQNKITTSVLDDLGHVKQMQVNSVPCGSNNTIYTDTTYDGFGRVTTVSNPYCTTSDPTYGTTMNQYDPLGRTMKVTKPDGSFVTTTYCGSTTLVTDETLHWRRSTTDALGRLVEVDEPNSLTATVNSNGCPGTGESIWVTSYSYDVVGNLLGVTQNGSRQRSFIYDSLASLTSSTNPEAGTVLYTYDSEEKVQTKKDARNLTITYGYEALHRMTGRTYSNGDPSAGYTYDQAGCLGQPTCYNIGRRTSMTDASGSESVSYDKMGREATHQRVTSGITKNTSYTYNLDGSLLTLVYPSGRTITYAYDAAARPASALDSANSINYATAGTYAPQGALAGLTMGSAGSFTGINLSNTFNKRLEPNEVKAWSTAGTAFDLSYCFTPWNTATNTCPATGNNNGNVTGIINTLDSNRTQFFSYDQVNRISTGQTVSTFSTNSAKCWGEIFGYDFAGNLLSTGVVSTVYNGCTQESLSVAVNANNQITSTGFSYDASGNFLTDSRNTYTWNAESEIKSAAGVNYTYDGDGDRVQKSNGKIYWYGAGTEVLDESDANGNITDEYVFFGGKRVAHRIVSGNSISYYAEDFLGSTRVLITSTGTVGYDADFYPFGGERMPYINTISQHYKFEGKERDTETNNDDFGARYYSSAFGRWISPDWSSTVVAIPYANPTNPQTLNLYAMVHDNPETFADLDGHDGHDAGGFIGDAAGWYENLVSPPPPPVTNTTQDSQSAAPSGQNNQQGQLNTAKPVFDSKKMAERIVQGAEALLNLEIANLKIDAAEALFAAASVGSETGPAAVGTALAGSYLTVSASGNTAASGIQLVGAVTGKTEEAAAGAKLATTITTGSGLIALVTTKGNLQTAAKWAAREGVITTNPKDLFSGKAVAVVSKVIDFVQSVGEAFSH